jgi:hypothetical protein
MVDFRLMIEHYGATSEKCAVEHGSETVTIFKNPDTLNIAVQHPTQRAGRFRADPNDVYVSITTPQASSPDGVGISVRRGESTIPVTLNVAQIKAAGIDVSHLLTVANQLSACKVTMRAPTSNNPVPLFASPSPSEAAIVNELGNFALQLAQKAVPFQTAGLSK